MQWRSTVCICHIAVATSSSTSDLPCYCNEKVEVLHVACIVGSRVRVQVEVILLRELNFLDVSFGSRVRFQALELFSMELNFLSVLLGRGFGSAWFNSPNYSFFACLALLP